MLAGLLIEFARRAATPAFIVHIGLMALATSR